MARIGISGTNSVGKSTLLHDLAQLPVFDNYQICDEVTRSLAKRGFKINEAGDDATQLAIMEQHCLNLSHENMLTDRTALDGLVYTAWLHNQGNVSEETVNKVEHIFDALIDDYDIIFYITPEFDLEDDGERSTSIIFRDEIAELFEDFIKYLNLDVLQLTGTREERVLQVLDFMEKLK